MPLKVTASANAQWTRLRKDMAATALSKVNAARKMKAGVMIYGSPRSRSIMIHAFAKVLSLEQGPAQQRIRPEHQTRADHPASDTRRHEMPHPGRNDVNQGHRQHEFPGKIHELI